MEGPSVHEVIDMKDKDVRATSAHHQCVADMLLEEQYISSNHTYSTNNSASGSPAVSHHAP